MVEVANNAPGGSAALGKPLPPPRSLCPTSSHERRESHDMTARLYLGTARYSSWSLRGWLMVRLAGLQVEEVFVPLAGGNSPAVKEVSPSGLVPFLEHQGARVWESLAIAEYCAEIEPGFVAGKPRGAGVGAFHHRRDACRVPRPAHGHADGAGPAGLCRAGAQ